ncbi:unnamed protein product [Gadus morhua 'NCC']
MGRSATETIRLRTGSSECHSTVHSTGEAGGPAHGPAIAPTVWTTRGRPSTAGSIYLPATLSSAPRSAEGPRAAAESKQISHARD